MSESATSLADKIVAIHQALDAAQLPHAFGGALALAWCTQRARGTIDIDVNGDLRVPRVPGLGAQIDWDAVRRYTV